MPSVAELEKISKQLKRDSLRMTHSAKSGHPGGSLGCSNFFASLFFEVMEQKPDFEMDGIGEDIFILSNGHISPVYYSTLARRGYFELSELGTFRKLNSRLQGHPATEEDLPGVRIATGSLGQGMSVGIGAALAKKQNKDDKLVYVLCGDGELQEGQNYEAMQFAAHHKVDNLIVTVDHNGQQIDGPTDKVIGLRNLKAKFEAFGWKVLETEGDPMETLLDTISEARALTGNGTPIAIIMKTAMGAGVDFMENNYKWHGMAPNDEELERALAQIEETLGDY